jgi:hypothetical protein
MSTNINTNIKEWIIKIIESCKDDFQFEAVDRLIALHQERFKNEEEFLELSIKRAEKWNLIHGIIEPNLNK